MVTAARDAATPARLLEGLEFDLIVFDVMMPGEDGLALTASLARDDDDADPAADRPRRRRRPHPRARGRRRRLPAEAVRAARAPAAHQRHPPARAEAAAEGRAAEDAAPRRGPLRHGPRRALARPRPDPADRDRIDADAHLRRPPARAVTRQELVEDLGGGIAEAQERAVDVQITRLRRKIEEDPSARATCRPCAARATCSRRTDARADARAGEPRRTTRRPTGRRSARHDPQARACPVRP